MSHAVLLHCHLVVTRCLRSRQPDDLHHYSIVLKPPLCALYVSVAGILLVVMA